MEELNSEQRIAELGDLIQNYLQATYNRTVFEDEELEKYQNYISEIDSTIAHWPQRYGMGMHRINPFVQQCYEMKREDIKALEEKISKYTL